MYSEDVLEVTTVKKEGAWAPNTRGNIFIALFTTAIARLKLYEALDVLQQRVLYYDTDSVIYKSKPDMRNYHWGNFWDNSLMRSAGISLINLAQQDRNPTAIGQMRTRQNAKAKDLKTLTQSEKS